MTLLTLLGGNALNRSQFSAVLVKQVYKFCVTSNCLQDYISSSTTMIKETKHLSQGSCHPPVLPGSLRLYNMRFCPYAQRSLLVAEAKQIPYDVVNVNLTAKPDWFLAINHRGLVPTLEFHDGDSLAESVVINDYLDEVYPDARPLYPRDPLLRAKDRLLVERFNKAIAQMKRALMSLGNPDQDLSTFEKLLKELDRFETELKTRGTNYFGGSAAAGMVDYMIWPWFERGVLTLSEEKTHGERFPHLKRWCGLMLQDPAVQKWLLAPDVHRQFLASLFARKPDFDFLLSPSKL